MPTSTVSTEALPPGAGRESATAPPPGWWPRARRRGRRRPSEVLLFPTSRPIHTVTSSGVATFAPFRPVVTGGKAVQGALVVIDLTNQRSVACPHQRFTHPTVPVVARSMYRVLRRATAFTTGPSAPSSTFWPVR